MSKTPQQVSADILSKLSVTAPGLSLEIGSPERKIVDACAESISESYLDNSIITSQFDVNTKTGTDLDQFVGMFGFGRLQGQYASGTVTFTLGYTATSDVTIPLGTQVNVPADLTSAAVPIYYATSQTVTIVQGTATIDAPAQCTIVGVIGNAASNTVTSFGTGSSIGSVTNLAPFSGGTDTETDDALRTRFQKTFLRNIAGTDDFYQGLMLQSIYSQRCVVLGPYSTWTEELQFNGTTKIFSSNPDCKYVWPQGWYLYQNLGTSSEIFYTSVVDYLVDPTVNPPGITPSNSNLTTTGAVADFQYQYTSTASRNDPANGIVNRVDVYVDGQQSTDVVEYAAASAITLNTTVGSDYNITNFVRETGATPTSGKTFQPLGSTPVLIPPQTIFSSTTTYVLGTDYHALSGITHTQGSSREIAGVEWITTPPTVGTLLTIEYTYNYIPTLMGSLLDVNKQITTDVLVHQAIQKAYYVYAVVVYNIGVNSITVNADINSSLTTFFSTLPFGAWIQFADVQQVIMSVAGVDNCRLANSADVGGGSNPYGIAWRINGIVQTDYTHDFKIGDSEIALFDGINIIRRAVNSF